MERMSPMFLRKEIENRIVVLFASNFDRSCLEGRVLVETVLKSINLICFQSKEDLYTKVDEVLSLIKETSPMLYASLLPIDTIEGCQQQLLYHFKLEQTIHSDKRSKRGREMALHGDSKTRSSSLFPALVLPAAEWPIYRRLRLSEYSSHLLVMYHEMRHFSTCKTGCIMDKYCWWFHTLLHHSEKCNKGCCSINDCCLLKAFVLHLRECQTPSCTLCLECRKEEEKYQVKMKNRDSLTVSSLFYYMSEEERKAFMETIQLQTKPWWEASKLRTEISRILTLLCSMDEEYDFFTRDVDVQNGSSDYYQYVLSPISLEMLVKKNTRGDYSCIEEFHDDILAMFSNARAYNHTVPSIMHYVTSFSTYYSSLYSPLLEKDRQLKEAYFCRSHAHICSICHNGDLYLLNPDYICSSCGKDVMEGRHSYYCSGTDVWCESCVKGGKKLIDSAGQIRRSTELTERFCNEEIKEEWIQCEQCKSWFHTNCCFFNLKYYLEKDRSFHFICVGCGMRDGVRDGVSDGMRDGVRDEARDGARNGTNPGARDPSVFPTPEDFASTPLSTYIEKRIQASILEIRKKEAERKRIPLEQAEAPQGLLVRMVYNHNDTFPLKPHFCTFFEKYGIPSALEYNEKCICLFQKQEGVFICLFVMYVYEYDSADVLQHNSVYISYLDSIHYLYPASYRTAVYQEILLSYLSYSQQHGFDTAHIWVCPPKKGDDYIFFSHPPCQKLPSEPRLLNWYHATLLKGVKAGIVKEITNMVDEYLVGNYGRSEKDQAILNIPCFPDDMWVDECEKKCKQILSNRTTEEKAELEEVSVLFFLQIEYFESEKEGFCRISALKRSKSRDSESSNSKRVKNKGEVVSELYHCLKNEKATMLVVKLQWQCCKCGNYLFGKHFTRVDDISFLRIPYSGGKKVHTMEHYLCDVCYNYFFSVKSVVHISLHLPASIIQSRKADPPIVYPVFKNRHILLNCIISNNYQFDTIRHASYSTYMLLYHCFHPSLSLSMFMCDRCHNEIVTGYRYNCHECGDYDECEGCRTLSFHPHNLHRWSLE